MKKAVAISGALLLLIGALGPRSGHAQTEATLGPRAGVDVGDVEEPFIGADLRVWMDAYPIAINPTFDIYFVDSGSFWSIAANGLYVFGVDNEQFDPYAGAGVGLYRTSVNDTGDSDVGLNFIFGAEFRTGRVSPFVEAQYSPVFGDGTSADLFNVKGGLLFEL